MATATLPNTNDDDEFTTIRLVWDAADCTEANCREAYSPAHTCHCSCGGTGHGLRYRAEAARGAARLDARISRLGGDVFALFGPADDEDDDFMPARNTRYVADPDDVI